MLKERFFNRNKFSNQHSKFILLFRKDVYPYEYMDDWENFNETSLPEKQDFYSFLNMEDITDTAQKMKFSVKDFFSKCDQIRNFLQIWSHILKKSVTKNFIFCAVGCRLRALKKSL